MVVVIKLFFSQCIANAYVYTIKSRVNLRQGPGLDHSVIQMLNHNQTLIPVEGINNWCKVITLSNLEGYIRKDLISDIWIKIHKKERKLFLLKGRQVLKEYNIALCPFNPSKDKAKQGDEGTPEGRFFICELIKNPEQKRYGDRSMRLSYPNIEDARRGLKTKLITYETYRKIVRQIYSGLMPNQRTLLGGSIRIHGGGSKKDWTLGCVALDDDDIIEIFKMIQIGSRVEIYKSANHDAEINAPYHLSRKILKGAKIELENPSLYTAEASRIIPLSYPMGDIPKKYAVCTDVVIRALRTAGIDLQALIHEGAVTHPNYYGKFIEKPNHHIDHRRTRNIQVYLSFNAMNYLNTSDGKDSRAIKPGDIIIMDTGVKNGTQYDHIGIVDNTTDDQENYKVINIWTNGYRTASMDLLGKTYPSVVGCFRMTHPFDYQ